MVDIGMNSMELNGYTLSVLRTPYKHHQVLLQGIKQVFLFWHRFTGKLENKLLSLTYV